MTQLVQLLADWRGDLPPGGAMCEEKRDGYRASWFTGADGSRRLWTRGGLPIEGVAPILSRLLAMERAAGERMMFDGEFQVDGSLAATKAWCERGWKQGGSAGHLFLFDCLAMAEWRAGGSDTPLWQRKQRLEQLVAATAPIPAAAYEGDDPPAWEWPAGSKGRIELDPVSVIPDRWVNDAGDVLDFAREVWAAGGEGCVVKQFDAPYRRNRNGTWAKVKIENRSKWERAAWRNAA